MKAILITALMMSPLFAAPSQAHWDGGIFATAQPNVMERRNSLNPQPLPPRGR